MKTCYCANCGKLLRIEKRVVRKPNFSSIIINVVEPHSCKDNNFEENFKKALRELELLDCKTTDFSKEKDLKFVQSLNELNVKEDEKPKDENLKEENLLRTQSAPTIDSKTLFDRIKDLSPSVPEKNLDM